MKPQPRRLPNTAPDKRPLTLTAIEHPGRAPLSAALRRCSEPQRTMLALMLVERLSSTEAAATLGIGVEQFERSYQALLVDLRRAMDRTNRGRWRATGRRVADAVSRLRKAS